MRAVPEPTPSAARIRSFRRKVWEHYRRHRRAMPWRGEPDPYRVLVSEVMLQQTQVDRVLGKYGRFLAAFPDFTALDRAPLAAVLELWRGLGYNRRAIALKRIARAVLERHGGVLPRDPELLVALPGIGRATAGSLAAFAYDEPVVFIETNIRRVFLHEFFPGAEGVPDAALLPLVERALVAARPREWYYALMDFGQALAKRVPNPNRRSAAYARQSRFEGSDRQVRGAILRELLARGPATADRLARALEEDPERVRRLVGQLEREGFVLRDGRRVRIGEGEAS
jgi:A/G-specific adenine glycosylase